MASAERSSLGSQAECSDYRVPRVPSAPGFHDHSDKFFGQLTLVNGSSGVTRQPLLCENRHHPGSSVLHTSVLRCRCIFTSAYEPECTFHVWAMHGFTSSKTLLTRIATPVTGYQLRFIGHALVMVLNHSPFPLSLPLLIPRQI